MLQDALGAAKDNLNAASVTGRLNANTNAATDASSPPTPTGEGALHHTREFCDAQSTITTPFTHSIPQLLEITGPFTLVRVQAGHWRAAREQGHRFPTQTCSSKSSAPQF